jgi:hypothetical protein
VPSEGWNEFHLPKKLFDLFCVFFLFCWGSQPKEAKLDQKSLKQLEDWTWQFVIVRPVVSILIVILELLGWYEGAITWICSIILNISVSLAMYSLILIYHVFHNELIPWKPLAKILCIKGVVFFSFWQVNLSLSLALSAQWFVFTLLSLKEMGHLEKRLMRNWPQSKCFVYGASASPIHSNQKWNSPKL